MAFYNATVTEEAVEDYQGGNFITTSGMYPVTVKYALAEVGKKNSSYINFVVEHNGQEQTIYQAIRITNGDDAKEKQNIYGQKLLNQVGTILGLLNDENVLSIEDPIEHTLNLGKDKKPTECMVLEDLSDVELIIRMRYTYSLYEGEIRENRDIANVFHPETFLSAKEMLAGVQEAKQYNTELEFASKITYKDDLTEEDVANWKKNKASKPKGTSDNKPSGGFTSSKKKFGR